MSSKLSPLRPALSCALYVRKFSTTASAGHANARSGNPSESNNNARRLSDLKLRLGRIFFHGATNEEVAEASAVLKDLSKNWREYVAGAEGFLTGEKRRGLFRHTVTWGDMDSMAHVNNAIYAKWAEAARINWVSNFGKYIDPANNHLWSELGTPKSIGLIVRSIKLDYKFPIVWPDKVSVYHKLNTIGIDSFTLDVIVLSEKHQRPAARCLEDIVVYNYRPAAPDPPGKTPVPDFMKPHLEETLRLQKEAEEDALERMQELEETVVDLEQKVFARKEIK